MEEPPPNSRLSLFPGYMERYLRTTAPEAVADYAQLAVDAGLSPTALAIAFCESRCACSPPTRRHRLRLLPLDLSPAAITV